jgi:hypothetical protein
MASKVLVRPEQIYVVSREGDGFTVGGDHHRQIPWAPLARCFIFALNETDLAELLRDAVMQDHMILDGSHSERRGLRGFRVGIGAWGHRGRVECRTIDAWCLESNDGVDVAIETGRLQQLLRSTCQRMNAEQTTFRGSALRWLGAVYRRLNQEPEGVPDPMNPKIALFCRRAHVGGPIVHARTSLEPFLTIDRDRAYGSAMLEDLPSGLPVEVSLKEHGMHRWRPRDLQSMTGIAEATVTVHPGPLVPLLPIMRWHPLTRRTKTIYPTGQLRGVWCLHELLYLEQSGRGKVEQLHKVFTFQPRPVFAPIIRYIRRIEPDLPIKVKRLEHMLYGSCARTLQMRRFATGYDGGQPLLGDVVEPHIMRRLGPDATIRNYALPGTAGASHRLYQVSGKVTGKAPRGTMDRPDRSAWITATNRIEMAKMIDQLDAVLKPERSGAYLGRIYVDGMDVQARPDQVPTMDGASLRRHGSQVRIYRAGAYVAHCHDKSTVIEATGTHLPNDCTEDDLTKALNRGIDLQDTGPFAGGRAWPRVKGHDDPRMLPNQQSEPLHLDLEMVRMLGFYEDKA